MMKSVTTLLALTACILLAPLSLQAQSRVLGAGQSTAYGINPAATPPASHQGALSASIRTVLNTVATEPASEAEETGEEEAEEEEEEEEAAEEASEAEGEVSETEDIPAGRSADPLAVVATTMSGTIGNMIDGSAPAPPPGDLLEAGQSSAFGIDPTAMPSQGHFLSLGPAIQNALQSVAREPAGFATGPGEVTEPATEEGEEVLGAGEGSTFGINPAAIPPVTHQVALSAQILSILTTIAQELPGPDDEGDAAGEGSEETILAAGESTAFGLNPDATPPASHVAALDASILEALSSVAAETAGEGEDAAGGVEEGSLLESLTQEVESATSIDTGDIVTDPALTPEPEPVQETTPVEEEEETTEPTTIPPADPVSEISPS